MSEMMQLPQLQEQHQHQHGDVAGSGGGALSNNGILRSTEERGLTQALQVLLEREGRRLLRGYVGGTGGGSGSSGGFKWWIIVVIVSVVLGVSLIILLCWYLNLRHRAKHGSNMWDRRSSRVADGATNDAAAPPPPAMGMPTYPPNKGPYDGAPAAGPVPM
ncbi:hypothetical protein CHLRE_07g326650v5 [Chlamydomonas reinhardtii]|uniref:Uncharacterized protein n=1 Tax=Chlamydomonas reinhardtii TaxID=3055 RepID=A0A2K3DJL3_CHLRE|nr:uncharacterized protein CHLRE_07g326650v5 [Chlamydomonas reinhardtii]PNW80708.1 hypothetical protein CHLRE_07g326650v5 [Chlamydomonas reinhardtii]